MEENAQQVFGQFISHVGKAEKFHQADGVQALRLSGEKMSITLAFDAWHKTLKTVKLEVVDSYFKEMVAYGKTIHLKDRHGPKNNFRTDWKGINILGWYKLDIKHLIENPFEIVVRYYTPVLGRRSISFSHHRGLS